MKDFFLYFIIKRSTFFPFVKSLFRNYLGRGERSKAGEFINSFQRVGANDKKEPKLER